MNADTNKNTSATNILASEQGVAIIAVLLLLMLLTFIGITATQTTITEKAVIRSDAIFEKDFYLAESAAMEGVQRIDNEWEPEELLAPLVVPGVSTNDGLLIDAADYEDPKNDLSNLDSTGDGTISGDDSFDQSELDPDNNTYRLVVQMPIESGSSLSLGASRLYSYLSYGYTEAQGGKAMIKVGYRKRF